FIQRDKNLDEIAFLISSADNTTISLNNKNYFTLNSGNADVLASVSGMKNANFITGENTIIVVNENGKLKTHKGIYNSTLSIQDGANVTVVMENEVGSTETLKYMYISDGKLGNYTSDAEYVRILAINGVVLENDKTYFEYTVYNFNSNTVEMKLSESASLEIGEDYRTGNDSCITTEKADHITEGFVNGHTASTLTIDGTTTPLADKFISIVIKEDHTIENVTHTDLYMMHVEYVVSGGEIVLIIAEKAPVFTAEVNENTIQIQADFDIADFDMTTLGLSSILVNDEEISVSDMTIAADNGTIVITSAGELTEGEYSVTFTLGGKTFTVDFSI
ncbi:MAG: hypothetical protein IJ325_10485, partial [Clostridia bacterium]|nr:hypothetical protein [Clostridia bacterium]